MKGDEQGMRGYTATFVVYYDECAGDTEKRWNEWVEGLASQGLEPSEEPIRYTSTTAVYALIARKHKKINGKAVGAS